MSCRRWVNPYCTLKLIYRKFDTSTGSALSSSLICEREPLHLSDDSGRISMLENRTYGTAADDNNTAATLTRYVYSNHLQSAALELDENALLLVTRKSSPRRFPNSKMKNKK